MSQAALNTAESSPELSAQKTKLERLLDDNPELNIPVHKYNINVTANMGEEIDASALLQEYRVFQGVAEPAHLYLHLPLCDYICHFCNYVKRLVRASDRHAELERWSSFLIEEASLHLRNAPWLSSAPISSFYIGGGTGALFLNNPEALTRLVDFIDNNFHMSPTAERSLEGNPENFTDRTVDLAQDLGFNRFSVGVQSLQDEVNEFAKRGHSAAEALRAIDVLLRANRPFSVDMMFGLPYQTIESVRSDIQRLVDLGVPAITIYRLRNSEREKMGIGNASAWNNEKYREQLDRLSLFPNVTTVYKMREAVTEILRSAAYHPSPCGWWNKPGTYPVDNIPGVSKDKWQNYNSMLGFGPGAYGWLSGNRARFVQTHNIADIPTYMRHMQSKPTIPPVSHGRILKGREAIGTKLSFSFKANQPISIQSFRSQFGVDLLSDEPYATVMARLIEQDLISYSAKNEMMAPTWKGEELHEEIMYVYFHEAIGGGADAFCRR